MAKKETALAQAEPFRLVQYTDGVSPEILEEIRDEMGDIEDAGPNFLKIRMPASGGLAFEVQDDDDGVEYAKTIDGVIVFTHLINGRWAGAYGEGDGTNKAPICASMDGKAGINRETGECYDCRVCPHNDFGSAIGKDGKPMRGKACKNMRRIYLMMNDNPNLYLLTVPPTSLRDVNRNLNKILASGCPYIGQIVQLSLTKVQSAGGSGYSKVTLRRVGPLPEAAAARAMEIRKAIKGQFAEAAVTVDDYAPAEATAAGNPVPVDAAPVPPAAQAAPAAVVFQDAPPLPSDADLPF